MFHSQPLLMQQSPKICRSEQAAHLLRDNLSHLDHEELWGIFLNSDQSVIATEMLTKGTLTATLIDARTILRQSLLKNAAKVIVAHNHPSGNPQPSYHDIDETRKIKAACSLMDIPLVDHIILTQEAFFSFAEEVVHEY